VLLAEDARRHVAEGLIGAFFVVGGHPFVDDLTGFTSGGEHVRIKDPAPVGLVEAFNIGVLRGFAGLNVIESRAAGPG
jgi:hypothetical protein